jgi:transcriptional regulator CtsR
MGNLQDYIKRKRRDLSDSEKQAIRIEIERGKGDVYKLAKKFHCVPIQIAGIKARMKF